MTVGIGEISGSIVTVIPKKFSSLLFINQCIGHTVKYYLKLRVLKYRPSLRGPCVENRELSEDADDMTQTRNPSVTNRVLLPLS